MEKMQELYEKVAGDSGLRAEFEEIAKNAEAAGEEAIKERLLAFAKEAGFEVTIEEAQEFFKKLAGKTEGSLSDDELDMVAGGKSTNGGLMVTISVLSAGVACAVASVMQTAQDASCGDMYQ